MRTIWVLGDQLNRSIGALSHAEPGSHILMVESDWMKRARGIHRQRVHFVITSMRRFAAELERAGFDVDYRKSPTLADGLAAHRAHRSDEVIATEPNSRRMRSLLGSLGVEFVKSDQFLCHPDEFQSWAGDKSNLRMEDFYRWQRKRLGYLMEGDQPAGGQWNYDADNREPPPSDGGPWPSPQQSALDELDRAVIEELPATLPGAEPAGWWATSRPAALARLNHFVKKVLPHFGPHEDAMLSTDWHMAHSLLSPYLNIGLLLPGEVCDRVEEAYREGGIPINSAEGFIRQVIGWREFVWGIYWRFPHQEDANFFDHHGSLPPAFTGESTTGMHCLQSTLDDLDARGWIHHIPRLMILSNFANLLGLEPEAVRDWMRERYIDGAEWVMGPNVMGMGLFADGGLMSTKPYVSGGAYINRMSDYCGDCRFDPKKRSGEDACPFTTLYWDFLDRHRDKLESNHRMARQYGTLDRLSDHEQLKKRAESVTAEIAAGRL